MQIPSTPAESECPYAAFDRLNQRREAIDSATTLPTCANTSAIPMRTPGCRCRARSPRRAATERALLLCVEGRSLHAACMPARGGIHRQHRHEAWVPKYGGRRDAAANRTRRSKIGYNVREQGLTAIAARRRHVVHEEERLTRDRRESCVRREQ